MAKAEPQADAGLPEKGEKKEADEECEPLFAETLSAQGRRSPLSSSFTSPAREGSLCRRSVSLYMVEREGARDVTARCRSSFLRTGVQACAFSSALLDSAATQIDQRAAPG